MRFVKIFFGVFAVLVGAAAIVGALTTFDEDRDSDDFFVSDGHRFERFSFAIASEGVDVLTGAPGWFADLLTDPVDVRIKGSSNTGSSLFLGIGDADDVEAYLADVAYDEVSSIEFEGADVDYTHRDGSAQPGAPAAETFWVASSEGVGVQTVDWSVQQGEWSVVVMNADGSVGVDADLVLGARISNIIVVAWIVLAVGVVLLVVGLWLFSRGAMGAKAATEGKAEEKAERRRARDWRFAAKQDEREVGRRFFEWVNRRYRWITLGVLVLALLMAGAFTAMGSDEEPEFDPSGDIYDVAERAESVFDVTTGVQGAIFLVEGPDDTDVLTRNALLEWHTNSESLRSATREVQGDALSKRLVTAFSNDLNAEVDGIYSIADAVDAELLGGLEGATDTDVKVALDAVLAADAPTAPLRGTLSRLATATPETIGGQQIELWESPAFQAIVFYDIDSFDIPADSADPELDRFLEAEKWSREAQVELRGDQGYFEALGVGIDFNLEFEEQAAEAVPFILVAVVIILIVVGVLLRSYWAAAFVGAGLVVTTLIYKGIFALIGFKGGLLLGFIVPISIISFGVDFFIHAIGRAREAQVHGQPRESAYPKGMSAVILALTLAALSSAAAFVSNAVSGIESVTQFGIGAAIALLTAFGVLGLLAPRLVLATEEAIGPDPVDHGPRVPSKIGFVIASVFAGATVAGAVQAPAMGFAVLVVYALLFMYVPFRWVRRRNRRAAARGVEVSDAVKGVGHGLHFAGYLCHFMARWRVVTIPVVVVLAILGLWGALQVRSDFAFTDFLSSRSDLVRSFDRQEHHFGDLGVGTGYIYVEGDLTDPTTLQAMQDAVDEVTLSGVEFARDHEGQIEVLDSAVSLARFATLSAAAQEDIAAATGVQVTDADGDGYPDSSDQVAAVYTVALGQGLRDESGQVVFPPDTVSKILYAEGDVQATRLSVVIGSFIDGPLIDASRAALEEAAENLRSVTSDVGVTRIGVSGEPLTVRNTLDAFTRSMLLSLPLALVLTFVIVALIIRSVKYSLVSVTPILLVVAWIYGFMNIADYTINPVTATIAAIAIGVGIDFATHFTVRFREELAGEPSRFPALRRAGEGTGGALTLSALTSIAGFLVMGLAPMPIFAVYGILTAVMIALAVLVTLLVLPSLLLFVTPSLKGEERERLEWERTRGEWVYEPHARDTATQVR